MRTPLSLARSTVPAVCGLALVLLFAGCRDNNVAVRDLAPPAPPQALYSVTGDGSVTLHWVKNTEPDLAGYRVYRGPSYAGPYSPLATTGATNYADNTPVNGSTYYYAVSAYDFAGNESDLSVENVNDTPRPAGTNLSLSANSSSASAPSGYDFSQATIRLASDPETDVYYDVSGGTRLMFARDLTTDIQDAGYTTTLDDLDWAPSAGWSPTGTAELILGHSYYVFTRDNHYAKFRVTSLTNALVKVDWAYQTDAGNPQLARHYRSPVAYSMGEKAPAGR
jgi:hypothetical protein